jgi:hypothetical protein
VYGWRREAISFGDLVPMEGGLGEWLWGNWAALALGLALSPSLFPEAWQVPGVCRADHLAVLETVTAEVLLVYLHFLSHQTGAPRLWAGPAHWENQKAHSLRIPESESFSLTAKRFF